MDRKKAIKHLVLAGIHISEATIQAYISESKRFIERNHCTQLNNNEYPLVQQVNKAIEEGCKPPLEV